MAGDRQRECGLPDAARPGQGDDAVRGNESLQRRLRRRSPDERCYASGEVGSRYAYLPQTDGRGRGVAVPNSPFTEQAIAAAGLSFQQGAIWTERLTDCPYVNLKRVFHDNGAGPEPAHQFVFGHK